MNYYIVRKIKTLMDKAYCGLENPVIVFRSAINRPQKSLDQISPYLFSRIENPRKDIKIIKNGQLYLCGDQHCSNGALSKYAIATALARGATLVIHHLENKIPELFLFYQDLLMRAGILIHFNCYWSPRKSSGAGMHQDSHDILVLQLFGEKNWRLPSGTITLGAGDALFLQRGTPHHPMTTERHGSIHITVGIVRNTARMRPIDYRNTPLDTSSSLETLDFIRSVELMNEEGDFYITTPEGSRATENSNGFTFYFNDIQFTSTKEIIRKILLLRKGGMQIHFLPDFHKSSLTQIILALYKIGFPLKIKKASKNA